MYTVGIWFVHIINLAVLAFVAAGILIYIQVKKGQYLKEAQTCIQCEIKLPTGHDMYYTVPLQANAEWVEVAGGKYKLDPKVKRWGLHPRLPFMGLRTLQVPIRKETWFHDNENPYYRDDETPNVTAAEIKAMTREASAIAAGAEAVEMEARQSQLVNAIANQPNKTYVYAGLVAVILGLGIVVYTNWQLSQVISKISEALMLGG